MLPVIFFSGGAQSARTESSAPSRARPYLVIAGLVLSFTLVTLFGSLLLSVLDLPQDVLRWAGIVVLGRIGVDTVVLTVAFALGAATPLLVFALAGRRITERVQAFRKRQRGVRITAGVLMLALSLGLVFNLPQLLQRLVPDYTGGLQAQVDNSEEVRKALNLGGLVNNQNKDFDKCSDGAPVLESCGTAPDLTGITQWLNSPAVDLKQQRGKVVLLDFWAYSCINCQRSLPHVTAWDTLYREAGLRVVGVHSPEYAFEKESGNVASAAKNFGITYPVALDNSLATWTNYRNRYWPAHYLIDAQGTVRHIKFGEGDYATTEKLIRQLLADAAPGRALPPATGIADQTPDINRITQETYLGSTKRVNFAGTENYTSGEKSFRLPENQARDSFTLDGDWTLGSQNITPTGAEARIRLNYRAQDVRIVLSGSGTLTYTRGGQTATVSPGVQAYSFTFG
ncbi:cytochrome c biogenesis protein DipZ [Allokutzneria sp. NRRL B-24872]|uniref:cytochrome c biogenesis protein DipZ n=1 Tax=Allokutzneria sp. NRRL B-24872 TaxID=1137961 RepID=UPI001FF01EB9|nr:redoxin family protein [Allokutzneria sp. NRRL B-24872]